MIGSKTTPKGHRRVQRGVRPTLARSGPTAPEGISGGSRGGPGCRGGSPATAGESLTLSMEEGWDLVGKPSSSLWACGAFCSGWGGGCGDPQGMPGPQPTPGAPWDGVCMCQTISTGGEMATWGMQGY